MTRRLYIDHSVVSDPTMWPAVEQAAASGDVQLALSLWNLFEIGAASDMVQQNKRLAFLEALNPLWLVERRAVQKQEVQRFLWRKYLGGEPDDIIVASPLLSMVDAFLCGRDVRIGLTPRRFIRELDYGMLNSLKILSPDAQKMLKGAAPTELKARDKEIFAAWLLDSVPVSDPNGRLMSIARRTELIERCYQERASFLAACAAMAVEDSLTTLRTSDRTRVPKESDGTDAFHTVVALSYCNIFFTRDRHQAHSARAIRSMLPRLSLAEVCTQADELLSLVLAMCA
jgi:hypothetical protein